MNSYSNLIFHPSSGFYNGLQNRTHQMPSFCSQYNSIVILPESKGLDIEFSNNFLVLQTQSDISTPIHCLSFMPMVYYSESISPKEYSRQECVVKEERNSDHYMQNDTKKVSNQLQNRDKVKEKPRKTIFSKRNIFKSIVRSMIAYASKNKNDLEKFLLEKGYSVEEIENSFVCIDKYKEVEAAKLIKMRFRGLIEEIIGEKSATTYILKKSLNAMLNNYNIGHSGKVTTKNLQGYKDLYKECLEKTKHNLKEKNFK